MPAFLSLIFFVISQMAGFEINSNPLYSLHSFFMAIWATMFTMLWKRRTKELNVEWGNFN